MTDEEGIQNDEETTIVQHQEDLAVVMMVHIDVSAEVHLECAQDHGLEQDHEKNMWPGGDHEQDPDLGLGLPDPEQDHVQGHFLVHGHDLSHLEVSDGIRELHYGHVKLVSKEVINNY